ncbi:DUF3616 domain-containing protein [Rhizobium johnstonii]|uniref:DUF3616 domain-containing protein n=1 Tax=Rhizobium johnstonii TaxID=3019933 RepID=UPI003F991C49
MRMPFKLLIATAMSACLMSQSRGAEISFKELKVPAPFDAPASVSDGKPRGISGMACLGVAADPSRLCFVINDEERLGQFAELSSNTLTPLAQKITLIEDDENGHEVLGKQRIASCPKGESKGQFEEFDGEGVAYADDTIFVSSSHSCNGKGKYKASSYLLARFLAKSGEKLNDSAKVEKTWRLADALALSDIGEDFGKAKTVGTNIEGIAVAGGNVYAGLRTPVDEGVAYLIYASIEVLFAPGNAELPGGTSHTIKVALGRDSGIRDLAALDDKRLLILSGPTIDQASVPYSISLLDDLSSEGVHKVKPLLQLPAVAIGNTIGKAETLTVLSNGASGIDIVVLYDNIDDGKPTVFHLDPQ